MSSLINPPLLKLDLRLWLLSQSRNLDLILTEGMRALHVDLWLSLAHYGSRSSAFLISREWSKPFMSCLAPCHLPKDLIASSRRLVMFSLRQRLSGCRLMN
ncbi:hypothetical protein F2Q69_00039470 [Brassica cretica]|uniref:Uncharacterized protein n=1 Tax=Brassica cretica TaxID=69181 RepID=A0A8S9NEE3_BRACR|nr:hypothetical protein F2Q69_00039470 [Brassica cretica]